MKKIYNVVMLSPSWNKPVPKNEKDTKFTIVRQKMPDVLYGNVAHLYLESYFRVHYPQQAARFKWHVPIYIADSKEDLLKYIVDYDIDILGLSMYVWNTDLILELTQEIKQLYNKDLLIVAGGPNCNANLDPEWNEKYPWIDHSIVGQGEKAWAKIMLDFLKERPLETNTANIVRFDKTTRKFVNDFHSEFLRDINFSPYVICKDLMKDIFDTYKDSVVLFPYETSRGCPYNCSYCDWTGGLHHKVHKRKVDRREEINTLFEVGVRFFAIADANFGMWEEDIEIVKQIAEFKKQGHHVDIWSYNLSKQKNHNVREIMRLIAEHNLSSYPKISVQDTHQEVLDASDRPDLTWEQNVEMVREIYNDFPHVSYLYVDLILGLATQTPEMWRENVERVYSEGMMSICSLLSLLPGAPLGYDQTIREKYKQEFKKVHMTQNGIGRHIYVEDIGAWEVMISSATFTTEELIYAYLFDAVHKSLFLRLEQSNRMGKIFFEVNKPIVDAALDSSFGKEMYKRCVDTYHKYNVWGLYEGQRNGKPVFSPFGVASAHILVNTFESISKPILQKYKHCDLVAEYKRNELAIGKGGGKPYTQKTDDVLKQAA
jgi:tRNA A37 methylthiotransferase MiaB